MAFLGYPLVIRPIRSVPPPEGLGGDGLSPGHNKSGCGVEDLDHRYEAQSSSMGSWTSVSRNESRVPIFQPTSDKSSQEAGSVRHGTGKSLVCRPVPEQYEGGVEEYEDNEEVEEEGEDEEEMEAEDEEKAEEEDEKEAEEEAEEGVEEERTGEEVDREAEEGSVDEEEEAGEGTSAEAEGIMVEGLYLSAREL